MSVALIEGIETAAMAALFDAAPSATVDELGIAHIEIAGAHCSYARAAAGSRELNHVHGLGIDGTAVDGEVLDAIAEWYAGQGSAYVVGIAPSGDPRLASMLTARGFTMTRPWAKFVYDERLAEAPPATALQIDAASGDEFGTVVVAGFGFPSGMVPWLALLPGRPGWTCLVARDEDGVAVATGALFVSGSCGWLSFGATLPAARGRGAQRALLARRVALARESGCELITTETGVAVPGSPQQSYRNIERAGFRVEYERPHLASPGFPA